MSNFSSDFFDTSTVKATGWSISSLFRQITFPRRIPFLGCSSFSKEGSVRFVRSLTLYPPLLANSNSTGCHSGAKCPSSHWSNLINSHLVYFVVEMKSFQCGT